MIQAHKNHTMIDFIINFNETTTFAVSGYKFLCFIKSRFKDTVTIFKFLWISDFFSNRRFHQVKARPFNSLFVSINCWVWILLFGGQTWWVIPMTSSIDRLKRSLRFGKNIVSWNRLIFSKFRLLVLFSYVNISGVTCPVSPEHYRKVRKFSMGWKPIRHSFSRV